jgi:hypothetical protein
MKEFLKVAGGIVGFIAILIGALTFLRNFNRQPSMILTSTECDPPCWYGIQPGQTNPTQTYEALLRLKNVNQESIMEYTDHYDKLIYVSWIFQRPAEDNAGFVYFDDQSRVTAIRILTVNSLKLGELFEKWGEPEKYSAEVRHAEDRNYLEVNLLYPSKGYLANVIIDVPHDANQVEIRRTTPVFLVIYFAPEMLPELLKTSILFDKPDMQVERLQPWTGLGTLPFQRQ